MAGVSREPEIPEKPEVGENWCCTRIRPIHTSFEWSIENFSFCRQRTGEKLSSCPFPAGLESDLEWRVDVYPRGIRDQNKEHISLYLVLLSSKECSVWAKVHLSIFDSQMDKLGNEYFEHNFSKNSYVGIPELFKREFLLEEGRLVDDVLIFYFEISAGVDEDVQTNEQTIRKRNNFAYSKLSDDMAALFASKKFSDAAVNVSGKHIAVHKAVLCTRSSAFSTMFQQNAAENSKYSVDIQDVDASTFEEMLLYMYSGKTPKLTSTVGAKNLLEASNKYGIIPLKTYCENYLISKLTADNALDFLVVAETHDVRELRNRALNFIRIHPGSLEEPAKCMFLVQEKPQLLRDVLMVQSALRARKDVKRSFSQRKTRVLTQKVVDSE